MRRNDYGAIIFDESKGYDNGRNILAQAIKKGRLEEPYCDVDKKHRGSALNYEIYDYARGVVLIQKRMTECTKYGNSPKKDYLLLFRVKGRLVTMEAPKKLSIVRVAKKDPPAGEIIQHIIGAKTAKDVLAKYVARRMGATV